MPQSETKIGFPAGPTRRVGPAAVDTRKHTDRIYSRK